MRDLEADWEDSKDYGPNEMVQLQKRNPELYNKIMSQNVGDQQAIDEFYARNLKRAEEDLYQQRQQQKQRER